MIQRLDWMVRLFAIAAFASAVGLAQRVEAQVFACTEEDIGTGLSTSGNTGDATPDDDSDFTMGCSSAGGADHVIEFTSTHAGTYVFDTIGSGYDTMLGAFTSCLQASQVACDDDAAGSLRSRIFVPMGASQTILIVVDGFNANVGAWTLNVTAPPVPPAPTCSADGPPTFQDLVQPQNPVVSASGALSTVGAAVSVTPDVQFAAGTTLEDVSVTIQWAKLGPGGVCPTDPDAALPVTGPNASQEETLFTLIHDQDGTFNPDGPDTRDLALVNDFTGTAPHGTYTTVTWEDGGFDPGIGSYGYPGDTSPLEPKANPFSDAYYNKTPFGTWRLQAGTSTTGEPMCIRSWTLHLTVRQPRADVDANPSPANEGGLVSIDMSCSSDQGELVDYQYDCNTAGGVVYTENGTSSAAVCSYADEGTYTVQVLVTDDDGGFGGPMSDTDTVAITINNVAPTFDGEPIADDTEANPHQHYNALVDVSDPGAVDDILFDVDGPGGLGITENLDGRSADLDWDPVCADLTDQPYTVTVLLDDQDPNGTNSDSFSLAVVDEDNLESANEDESDGDLDCADNCPFDYNPGQENYDSDIFDLDVWYGEDNSLPDPGSQGDVGGDACDQDDDNDGISDGSDDCDPDGDADASQLFFATSAPELGWTSQPNSDFDADGCKDNDTAGDNEDGDDDDDTVLDAADKCDPDTLPSDGPSFLESKWSSDEGTDYDGDGCMDVDGNDPDALAEDDDDDNDGVTDLIDICDPDIAADDDGPVGAVLTVAYPSGVYGSITGTFTDHDGDGCSDGSVEDDDDDNDGRSDGTDDCPAGDTNWNSQDSDLDYDGDGCRDANNLEDDDDDEDGILDTADQCDPDAGDREGVLASNFFTASGDSDYDSDGCQDEFDESTGDAEDADDDADGRNDDVDNCDPDPGVGPNDIGGDNFNSELGSIAPSTGTWQSTNTGGPNGTGTDWDQDGCLDDDDSDGFNEDPDDDNDGVLDGADDCDPTGYSSQGQVDPSVFTSAIGWSSSQTDPDLDYDADGCLDSSEDLDDDDDRQLDTADDCDPDDEVRTIYDGSAEDSDDSNTGWNSAVDTAPANGFPDLDHDNDGCEDSGEDADDDNDRADDAADDCDPSGFDGAGLWNPGITNASAVGWDSSTADYDQDGCQDSGEDTDDDDDVRLDGADACDSGTLPTISSEQHWPSLLPNGCTVHQNGPNTYLSCTGAETWQNARYICQGLGGDLANIDNGAENTYVASLATLLAAAPWAGGHDQFGAGAEGEWVWADTGENFWNGGSGGSVATYASWGGGEPNNSGDEDCLQVGGNGLWNDLPCAAANQFICEVAIPPTEQDYDDDGCKDEDGSDVGADDEDEDDDADAVADATDMCDPDSGVDFDTDGSNDAGPAGAVLSVENHAGAYLSNIGALTSDHDGDGCEDGDDEDADDDDDGRSDDGDDCDPDDEDDTTADTLLGDTEASLSSTINWSSDDSDLDWDGDGCKDEGTGEEDADDDSDQLVDGSDDCDPDGYAGRGHIDPPLVVSGPYTRSDRGWDATPGSGLNPPFSPTDSDFDNDGCQDSGEDDDDDDDRRVDLADDCDPDDEDDLVADLFTAAQENAVASQVGFDSTDDLVDHDDDGCLDNHSEDNNDDNDHYLDGADVCPKGVVAWEGDDYDSDGCEDYTSAIESVETLSEDVDLDNDGVLNAADLCDKVDGDASGGPQPDAFLSERDRDGFVSNTSTNDRDHDGCKDEDYGVPSTEEDGDDDGDTVLDDADDCDPDATGVSLTDHGTNPTSDTGWISSHGVGVLYSNAPGTDWDGDGCQDSGEDDDDDADGRKDDLTASPSDQDGDRCDPDNSVPAGDTGIVASLRNPGGTDADQDGCREPDEDLDGDNDGKLDADGDLCVGGFIGTCVDYDDDGCCDVVGGPQDGDDDNDGVADAQDACDPSSGFPTSSIGDYTDYDNDGCEDSVEDNDNDNDGVLNPADGCDTSPSGFVSDHGTGTPGNDYNNDGCRDSDEDPDDDSDGVSDILDRCDPDATLPSSGVGLPAADTGVLSSVKGPGGDYDGDGCKDANIDADPDDDNDGIADATDLCDPDTNDIGPVGSIVPGDSGANPNLGSFASVIGLIATDADGDGCSDSSPDNDNDVDGDGKPDGTDNCPNLFNPAQTDVNPADGIGDLCAGDDDGDGAPNDTDNCPNIANPNQTNTDQALDNNPDGLGDACDDDDDGDGVLDGPDNCELVPNGPNDQSTQADDMDADGEGDVCDEDRDGDGLLNDDEDDVEGPLAGLDSSNPDTDGDGIDDGTEVGDDLLPDNPGTEPDGDGLIDDPQNPRNTDLDFTNGDDVIDALEGPDSDVGDGDSDADSLLDVDEAGDPQVDDPFPRDTDGDGTPDYRDTDSDDDGFDDGADDNCDVVENDQTNTDVLLGMNPDGLGDACDDDIDGDTLTNDEETALETDPLDLDSDDDGIDDPTEVGPDPSRPNISDGKGNAEDGIDANDLDSDDDGISDAIEAGDPEGATFPANTDGTDLPDYRDNDSDNDGIGDVADNCRVVQNQNQTNSDAAFANGDALGNACDTDDDNDGVLDTGDNCPVGPTQNPSQTDSDGDATVPGPFPGNGGDVCDVDDDNDGDTDDADNCPNSANGNQADQDGDDIGDVCDTDLDGDGTDNGTDNCPTLANPGQEESLQDTDTAGDACDTNDDSDTLLDTADNCSLVTNEDQANFDGDALGDVCDPDDDNDLVPDSTDTCDFNNSSDQTDTDEDGFGNPCDPDDDDDEVVDGEDNCPLAANENQRDTDDDGDGDACDNNDDDDALTDRNDNCPTDPNDNQADNDDDGRGDVCDDDDDNDGVDDDDDNCPVDANKSQSNDDDDDDGNACDDDDDNDGIPDDQEEEDAGVEPPPEQDAGPRAGNGGNGGNGGTGGAAGGAAGTGSPDAGATLVECNIDAIADAADFVVPEKVSPETIAAALEEAGFQLPETPPTADEIRGALEDHGIKLAEDCDFAVLIGEIKKRAVDDGCGCSTVGAQSEYGGTRAALLGGLALALGYRRRRRAA